ncbi:hypothetical protein [Pseudomonas fluorescens]|jgi:hypothetical protein|uniref:hypothetical protein n=1 Tax=Pseudomonas fluorescens TaxID=294 RepID=UPI0018781EEA|nr:hypothetical protein [Pseudomonas fluorescens]
MQHTYIDGGALQRDEVEDLTDRHSGPLRLIGVESKAQASMLLSELALAVA